MQGYDTPHEAIQAMDHGVASGKYKPCVHLGYTLSGSPFNALRYYYPVCAQDCFVSDIMPEDMACPRDCRLYIDRKAVTIAENEIKEQETIKERRGRIWNLNYAHNGHSERRSRSADVLQS
jgi:hypothetical protein